MNLTSVIQVTHNSRALAGLPTANGGRIAPVVFRSDALASLTESGLRALTDLGIGTVIDLRTDGERQRAADVLPPDGSVTLIPLAVQGGAMDEMARRLLPADGSPGTLDEAQIAAIVDRVPTLEELYVAILESSAVQFATLARAVIEANGTDRPGVLFHCTAGKDRTGLAAALLLSVADVAPETIIADYTQTETNLAGPFGAALTSLITSLGLPMTPRLETLATRSPATAIEAALRWIRTEHGDSTGYLASGGLTSDELQRLRRALVDAD